MIYYTTGLISKWWKECVITAFPQQQCCVYNLTLADVYLHMRRATAEMSKSIIVRQWVQITVAVGLSIYFFYDAAAFISVPSYWFWTHWVGSFVTLESKVRVIFQYLYGGQLSMDHEYTLYTRPSTIVHSTTVFFYFPCSSVYLLRMLKVPQ